MENIYDVIIVGAGPGGLQAGALLENSGLRYIICEKSDSCGTFFLNNPISGKLISFNKKHNIYKEKTYNMRFDWNSLLSSDDSLLFTSYTNKLYPKSSDLYKYLNDFAKKLNLKIKFNTKVNVRLENKIKKFCVTDGTNDMWSDIVLMATGTVSERIPQIPGAKYADSYWSFNKNLSNKNMENKELCIIGGGNSAFELYKILRKTNELAVIRLHLQSPLKFAHNTHFPGHIRDRYLQLDMWQFEQLDFIAEHPTIEIKKLQNGKLETVTLTDMPHWSEPKTLKASLTYDYVVFCTGFNYVNPNLFENFQIKTFASNKDSDNNVKLSGEENKFPLLSPLWETNVKGLFFIGSAMRANDNLTSTPFIFGFRYCIRTLIKFIFHKYFNRSTLYEFQLPYNNVDDLNNICSILIKRVSTTDALVALRNVLCDIIVYFSDTKIFQFYEEIPVDCVFSSNDEYKFLNNTNVFIITMEYGQNNYSSSNSFKFTRPSDHKHPHCSYYIHPIFRYFEFGKKQSELHLQESLYGRFDNDDWKEFNDNVNHSKLFNFLIKSLKLDETLKRTSVLSENDIDAIYRPWNGNKQKFWIKNQKNIQPKCESFDKF